MISMEYENNSIQHRVRLYANDSAKLIGRMEYYIWEDHVSIQRMMNESSYRHIGTLLHEHAFRESFRFGKAGDVRFYAVNGSHYFHYINGFRPYQKLDIKGLDTLRAQLLKNPEDPETQTAAMAFIEKNQLAETLTVNTQDNLGLAKTTTVSVQAMLKHGVFATKKLGDAWEKKFAAMGAKKDTSTWPEVDMYCPPQIIAHKRKLFKL